MAISGWKKENNNLHHRFRLYNIAAHTEAPAGSENLQSFASEKDLAKLAVPASDIGLLPLFLEEMTCLPGETE